MLRLLARDFSTQCYGNHNIFPSDLIYQWIYW